MNSIMASNPGCLVRIDYYLILTAIHDKPGINSGELSSALTGRRSGTMSFNRLIDALTDTGYIDRTFQARTLHHSLTDKGERALRAVESVASEVGL